MGAKTMQSKVVLDYDRAIVEERCTATCKGKQIEFDLAGHLEYMPKHLEAPSFETNGDFIWHQKLDWFSDIKIPEFKPLMKLIAQHWKLTLAALNATMLDEVDMVTHIEPLANPVRTMEQKIDFLLQSFEQRMQSTVQRLEQMPTTTPRPGLWSEVLHLHRRLEHAPVPVAWHIKRFQAQKDLNVLTPIPPHTTVLAIAAPSSQSSPQHTIVVANAAPLRLSTRPLIVVFPPHHTLQPPKSIICLPVSFGC
ncbi:unnamed protein product [Cylicocyclus nassatus]|uniref:Uncharacterized protein n=1 Tax=Cylicocyclus nassatus TaxID=53992 RepID=A0AA36H3S5_CYLNA|nr:unnamed protein product [Cylicocyclus nassatus]